HRPEAPRPALLGKPVPVPESGQEPVRESRVPAAGDRADHAREAPALHREVHDRGRPPEDRAVPPLRGAEARGTPRPCHRDGEGAARRAQVRAGYPRGEQPAECWGTGGGGHPRARAALAAGAEVIVTLDADGQHPPEQIPHLVVPIAEGRADLVLGARARSGAMPLERRLSNWLSARLASRIGGQAVSDAQTGFRAFT